jgi:hypothetical protein
MPKDGRAETTEELAKETVGLKRAHQLDEAAIQKLAARISEAAPQEKARRGLRRARSPL